MSIEAPNLDRHQEAQQLLHDFELTQDAEFFSEPSRRIEFMQSLDYDDFVDISTHINARVRGYEPRDQVNAHEEGSYLPMLKTPLAEEKPEALRMGFDVIQRYLAQSPDDDEQKAKSAGMAVEALIVWTHPFNDGNGRTSRFLGKFLEDGTTDTERLITETSDKNERMRMYGENARIDNTIDLEHSDLMLDDDEIEAIKKEQTDLPITEGIARSIDHLLNDKELQGRIEAEADRNQQVRQNALARQAA